MELRPRNTPEKLSVDEDGNPIRPRPDNQVDLATFGLVSALGGRSATAGRYAGRMAQIDTLLPADSSTTLNREELPMAATTRHGLCEVRTATRAWKRCDRVGEVV